MYFGYFELTKNWREITLNVWFHTPHTDFTLMCTLPHLLFINNASPPWISDDIVAFRCSCRNSDLDPFLWFNTAWVLVKKKTQYSSKSNFIHCLMHSLWVIPEWLYFIQIMLCLFFRATQRAACQSPTSASPKVVLIWFGNS